MVFKEPNPETQLQFRKSSRLPLREGVGSDFRGRAPLKWAVITDLVETKFTRNTVLPRLVLGWSLILWWAVLALAPADLTEADLILSATAFAISNLELIEFW